ncbi:MAG: lipopolysaccharide biosynthesis protein [Sphingobium sp.]|uniref:lipopolysaccharide biosynthesis protein n=1 Tax=Sphingobium sp. TaxID=1912891 RepID=UPI0029AF305C|nr:lipopolysaccharide biosynthesis protein [Sphingobium sp.]MDX3909593.1 lipopolysaccharide biosynthesis protein [Sphingobium sp.]
MIGISAKGGTVLARLRAALRHQRVKSVSHLLTGTAATLVITLLSIALVARALGPTAYGILALILTLGQACERLLSFQSWQPLIRYGATLNADDEVEDFSALLKFGLLLDLAGSAAAWAVASIIAIVVHFIGGISFEHTLLSLMFLLSLLFNFNGVATAIFRLTGRYRTIARLQVANALLRLALLAVAFKFGAGLTEMVAVWTVTQILGSLSNLVFALRAAPYKAGVILKASLKNISTRFPGLWRFTWGSNMSLTLWSSAQQVDTLLVGWLADPASAGLFHIAKRVSRIVQQVGSQVESVVYPDLARLAGAGNRRGFLRVLLQTEAILALFGAACFLTILLAGQSLIRLALGDAFAGAVPLMTIQILAVTMTISGAASRASLLALGDQRSVLRTVMACTLAFYCAAPPLILTIGAMGANIAHLLFGVIWLGGLSLHVRKAVKAASWNAPSAPMPDEAPEPFAASPAGRSAPNAL